MFVILKNPNATFIILSFSFLIGIILLCLMLKLIKQQPKNAIRIIAAWLLIYPSLFLSIPILSEAFWRWSFLEEPISRVIMKAIAYPFFYKPGIVNQCLTPIFPIELFFYCLWLTYFVSGIGILRLKNWARVLGIYAAEAAVIFSFGLWLYNGLCLDAFISTGIYLGAKTVYRNLYSLTSLFENILPIGFPSLIFWILLTRNEIKAQFNRK